MRICSRLYPCLPLADYYFLSKHHHPFPFFQAITFRLIGSFMKCIFAAKTSICYCITQISTNFVINKHWYQVISMVTLFFAAYALAGRHHHVVSLLFLELHFETNYNFISLVKKKKVHTCCKTSICYETAFWIINALKCFGASGIVSEVLFCEVLTFSTKLTVTRKGTCLMGETFWAALKKSWVWKWCWTLTEQQRLFRNRLDNIENIYKLGGVEQ